jgi:hypothetical protein
MAIAAKIQNGRKRSSVDRRWRIGASAFGSDRVAEFEAVTSAACDKCDWQYLASW